MVKAKEVLILIVDDDEDDRLLAQEALKESRLLNEVHFVVDGEDLMDYLHRRGRYGDLRETPLPDLILLDLNMPKKDGREALKEIRAEPVLRAIPVVVLTTSREDEDVNRSYSIGANSFITKPVTFEGLTTVMKDLGRYWFQIVELPATPTH